MSRIGRPKVAKPKIVKYSIRIDEEMEAKLKEYCKVVGISKGEAIRRGIHMIVNGQKHS